MALTSPGVEVTIVDQSQYLPAAPASVPLIVLATASNKSNAAGTGIAVATTTANANKLYAVTSQRDLVTLYGNPFFYKTTNGTALQGYELNEYGLLAAYSVLGTTNLCYVLRADIDLASLVGRTTRPVGAPGDNTYWLNLTNSTWGIQQFNQTTGLFTTITPLIINNTADMFDATTGQPLASIGNVGDYAISFVTDSNNFSVAAQPNTYDTYWFKDSNTSSSTYNTWVELGGLEWRSSWATIQGTDTATSLTAGNAFDINGVTVAVPVGPNNDLDGLVGAINSAGIPFVSAANISDKLELYLSINGSIVLSNNTGTIFSDLGLQTGTYYSPAIFYGTNAQQPLWRITDAQPHPTGSVWIKTNAVNRGTNLVVNQYNSLTATYTSQNCPLAVSDWVITSSLDSAGGENIPAGTLYAQYSQNGQALNAPIQLFRRSTTGPTIVIGSETSPLFATTSFDVYVSEPGSSTLLGPYTVATTSGDDATDFVTAWTAANIPYTEATVTATGAIALTHVNGGVIILDDSGVANSAITEAGFEIGATAADCTPGCKWGPYKSKTFINVAVDPISPGNGDAIFTVDTFGYVPSFTITTPGTGYNVDDIITLASGGGGAQNAYILKVTSINLANGITGVEWISGLSIPLYTVQLSNWYPLAYIPNEISPSVYPNNGTNWYYSVINQVDIMTNFGGVWKGYKNVNYAANGLPQATGVNATDPNGPILSASVPETQSDGTALVYGDLWIDTGDLENYPVIYRWQSVDGDDQWVLIDNTDQLTENGIVFADARWGTSGSIDPVYDPLPSISGLLNSDYTDLDAPSGTEYPQGTLLFNTRRSGYNVKQFKVNYFNAVSFPDSVLPAETSTWVTISGNQSNGAPYMGRQAQRVMVVKALKASLNTNTQIRDEDTFFNLIACPNYPELQPEMALLDRDRNETAYIIGDTPMRLVDDANAIINWANNTAGVASTNEDGLTLRYTYMGLYYPSGMTTDLTGTDVVIPPSHMILRTMIYNDTVAYPWFAPAGQRRGIVDNASSIGYINPETNEYVITKNRVQLRDVEYNNFINPIATFTNVGILNFGNKNSFDSQSSLDRTNVARLVCYLRWNLQRALRPFIFEPNDNITRSQARAIVQTLLADIQSKRGIYDYIVVCDESNNTPARIDRNELWVDVAIEPIKAAEFIYVPVRILNTGEIAALTQNG